MSRLFMVLPMRTTAVSFGAAHAVDLRKGSMEEPSVTAAADFRTSRRFMRIPFVVARIPGGIQAGMQEACHTSYCLITVEIEEELAYARAKPHRLGALMLWSSAQPNYYRVSVSELYIRMMLRYVSAALLHLPTRQGLPVQRPSPR